MSLESYAAGLVWAIPLISSLFVPAIGRYSEKIRNYFTVSVAATTAVLALLLVPSVWFSNGEAAIFNLNWLPGIAAGVYLDPLSVLVTCLVAFF